MIHYQALVSLSIQPARKASLSRPFQIQPLLLPTLSGCAKVRRSSCGHPMQYAPTQVLFARQWLPSPVSDRQIHVISPVRLRATSNPRSEVTHHAQSRVARFRNVCRSTCFWWAKFALDISGDGAEADNGPCAGELANFLRATSRVVRCAFQQPKR